MVPWRRRDPWVDPENTLLIPEILLPTYQLFHHQRILFKPEIDCRAVPDGETVPPSQRRRRCVMARVKYTARPSLPRNAMLESFPPYMNSNDSWLCTRSNINTESPPWPYKCIWRKKIFKKIFPEGAVLRTCRKSRE
jgi:hypothetical protein